MNRLAGIGVLCVALGLSVSPCLADIIQGGTGLGPSATVIDFEGWDEGQLIDTQYAGVGVSFFTQDDPGTPMIDNLPQLYGYGPTSGVGMLTGSMTGGAPFPTVAGLIAEFGAPQLRAGAFFSDTAPLGDYTITAFDTGGGVLESFVLAAGDIPFPGDYYPPSASPDNAIFVGFEYSSPLIGSIQFGPSSGYGDSFCIDDLQFVVPAPPAVLLGLIGMGVVGWVKRRVG